MSNPEFEAAKKAFQANNERLAILSKVQERLDDADEQRIASLAVLSPLQYAKRRKQEAKGLGVSISALDKAVKVYRDKKSEAQNGLRLKEFSPFEEPVDGQRLLSKLVTILREYVVLSESQALVIALWVIRAHVHDLFDFNPRLAILSPEKRCGKSTLLEVLFHLVPRSLLTSNVSPAAVFRVIEISRPTLLIDELDSFKDADESLRGILNSGHRRTTAMVVRCTGEMHEPKTFSTWCPMALAAIGRLPGTLEDRSFIIHLKRRKPTEKVKTFRHSGMKAEMVHAQFEELARKIARWGKDNQSQLRDIEPDLPQNLSDRAADNWFSLLVIAEAIAGEWPARARNAALELTKTVESSEGVGVQLLTDIQTIIQGWEEKNLPSGSLCAQLADLEERPWGNWKHGKPLTQVQLAKLLQPFGIKSRPVRTPEGSVMRGYPLEDFEDAFSRYLMPSPSQDSGSKCYSATLQASIEQNALIEGTTSDVGSTSEKATISPPDEACSTVAVQQTLPEGGGLVRVIEDDA